jgi:hypothetical protein
LARHERNIRATARTELKTDELLSILSEADEASDRDRQQDIACYLSGSEGWDEAVQRLGGAFAAAPTELRRRKAD